MPTRRQGRRVPSTDPIPWLRRTGTELLSLLLPVGCAGCGRDDEPWCPDCRALLRGPARRCEDRAGRLDRLDGRTPPWWALTDFTGPVRRAVTAWKDHGRSDLTAPFADGLRRGARAMVPTLTGCGPVLVVPLPSTAAARRARGWDPVGTLAGVVADELVRRGVPASSGNVLRRTPGADQSGLSARDRARNLAGHVLVRRPSRVLGAQVVLVDDVLTTRATAAAASDVLVAAGARVRGGVVLASTPPPGRLVAGPAAR